MKKILFLNDFSPESDHALYFTLSLASTLNTGLLIWNMAEPPAGMPASQLIPTHNNLIHTDNSLTGGQPELQVIAAETAPQHVTHLPELHALTRTLHQVVYEHDVLLIVKSVSGNPGQLIEQVKPISAKTHCPLLLVPANFDGHIPQSMVYLTDLRFCRHDVLKFARQFASLTGSRLTIAHFADHRIPPISESYSRQLFQELLHSPANTAQVSLNYIEDGDVQRAADVLINTLGADLLILPYGCSHFSGIAREGGEFAALKRLSVPMLVFPS